MFQLREEPVKLSHLNVREEVHGEEKKQAVDLKFERVGSNAILDDIAPGMTSALYLPLKEGDQADAFNGGANGRVALAFETLEMPLKLDGDYPGYKVDIETGLGLEEDVTLTGTLKKSRLTAQKGGSAKHEFTVSTHPDSEQVGRLYAVLGKEVTLSLTPPEPAAKHEDDEGEDGHEDDGEE
jgi:hypothetical protein